MKSGCMGCAVVMKRPRLQIKIVTDQIASHEAI